MTDSHRDRKDELLRQFEEAIAGMGLDDLRGLAGGPHEHGAGRLPPPSRGPSRRQPRRDAPATYRLRVDLEQARPPIWRRLDVRSDTGLETFHQILQAAFGWNDSHLHRFALGDSVFDRNAEMFLCPFDAEEGDEEGVPASDVHLDEVLAEPGDVLRYCYDYGDSWDLDIVLESVRPQDPAGPAAVCVDGRRAGPPEDCGGRRTADDLAEVLDDPAHFDLLEVNQALSDPFIALGEAGVKPQLLELLTRLRGTAVGDDLVGRVLGLVHTSTTDSSPEERAAALRPMLWFLDHVGTDGLALTPSGYLKRADIVAATPVLPALTAWSGGFNREVNAPPLLHFRQSLQELGLVRKLRGRLVLTKGGAKLRGGPDALWRHLCERLPLGPQGSFEQCAGRLALVWAASSPGESVPVQLLADALNALGWRQGRNRIDDWLAHEAVADTLDLLDTLASAPWNSRMRPRPIAPVASELARDAIRAVPPA